MARKKKRSLGSRYETACEIASRHGLPKVACEQIKDMIVTANRRMTGGYKIRFFVNSPSRFR